MLTSEFKRSNLFVITLCGALVNGSSESKGIVISQLNEKYNNDLQAKKDTSDMAEVITGFTRL